MQPQIIPFLLKSGTISSSHLGRHLWKNESLLCSLVFYGKIIRFYSLLCFTVKWISSMQSCVLRKNQSLLYSPVFYGKMNRFYSFLCFTVKESLLCSLVFYGKINRFYTVPCFTEKWVASMHSCVLRKNESLLCSLVFNGKMNRFYAACDS